MEDIAGRIEREVASWDGVTTHAHRFGGIEFRLGRREIGHLHGERWADLPFQKGIRDMLVETGALSRITCSPRPAGCRARSEPTRTSSR